jgi:hypothetical protein
MDGSYVAGTGGHRYDNDFMGPDKKMNDPVELEDGIQYVDLS